LDEYLTLKLPMKGVYLVLAAASAILCSAEEVAIHVERSTSIRFPSQSGRAYKLLAAEDPSGSWSVLKDGITGTGGEVTIFYKSEADQKLFFKIETSDGPPGQRSLISLARLDVSKRELQGYDLEGADLRDYKFYESILDGANLAGADLRGAGFQNATMKGADLRNAILGLTSFYGVDLEGADFSGVNLGSPDTVFDGANLRGAKLVGARFQGARMPGVNLSRANLSNTSFQGAVLDGCDFSESTLAGADFSRASVSSVRLTGTTLTGLNLEGADFLANAMAGRDLRGILLRGAVIGGADWRGVTSSGSDLRLLAAVGTLDFSGSDLSNAQLAGLQLRSGGLPSATPKMRKVNFRQADLRGADLRNSDLGESDFTGANLAFADLTGADLTGAIGFDPDQPGMQFGPRTSAPGYTPDPKFTQGTILPDGTPRSGSNPGESFVPANPPERLHFSVCEGNLARTFELSLAAGRFNFTVGRSEQGRFQYVPAGIFATLTLIPDVGTEAYKLLFTSPEGGALFQHTTGSDNSGAYLIGSFRIL
jgi:uncharacterized protein YjbI with pentapeptide repeats